MAVGQRYITLSIIIAGDDASAGLASLGILPPDVETIVVDAPGSLPERLAAGMLRARGEWVAMTEVACTFAPDWLGRACELAACSSASAIGGAVEPGDELRLRNLALYFCDYAQFLPPFDPRRTSDLPGSNVLFRRSALAQAELSNGFWKSMFCRTLAASGGILELDPSLVVYHHRSLSAFDLLARRWTHGRCWGAMRADLIPPVRRLAYAIAVPALPPLLVGRVMFRVWRKRRMRREIMLSLPWIALLSAVWIAGEWMGNLFGARGACEKV